MWRKRKEEKIRSLKRRRKAAVEKESQSLSLPLSLSRYLSFSSNLCNVVVIRVQKNMPCRHQFFLVLCVVWVMDDE